MQGCLLDLKWTNLLYIGDTLHHFRWQKGKIWCKSICMVHSALCLIFFLSFLSLSWVRYYKSASKYIEYRCLLRKVKALLISVKKSHLWILWIIVILLDLIGCELCTATCYTMKCHTTLYLLLDGLDNTHHKWIS